MRIIAGACRGRKLAAPVGLVTRPTSDRVKEALFSILTSRVNFAGLRVLDICAGSGSLGIEALSRGAEFCCFIEKDPAVKQILHKNLVDTGLAPKSEIIAMAAEKALAAIARQERRYDLIFFDPPYSSGLYQSIPDLLDSLGLPASGSILIVECSSRGRLPESYGCLKRFDRRVYGETAVELYLLEEK